MRKTKDSFHPDVWQDILKARAENERVKQFGVGDRLKMTSAAKDYFVVAKPHMDLSRIMVLDSFVRDGGGHIVLRPEAGGDVETWSPYWWEHA